MPKETDSREFDNVSPEDAALRDSIFGKRREIEENYAASDEDIMLNRQTRARKLSKAAVILYGKVSKGEEIPKDRMEKLRDFAFEDYHTMGDLTSIYLEMVTSPQKSGKLPAQRIVDKAAEVLGFVFGQRQTNLFRDTATLARFADIRISGEGRSLLNTVFMVHQRFQRKMLEEAEISPELKNALQLADRRLFDFLKEKAWGKPEMSARLDRDAAERKTEIDDLDRRLALAELNAPDRVKEQNYLERAIAVNLGKEDRAKEIADVNAKIDTALGQAAVYEDLDDAGEIIDAALSFDRYRSALENHASQGEPSPSEKLEYLSYSLINRTVTPESYAMAAKYLAPQVQAENRERQGHLLLIESKKLYDEADELLERLKALGMGTPSRSPAVSDLKSRAQRLEELGQELLK